MNAQHSLAEIIRRSVEGNAWHGPSIRENLADVMAAEAAAKPIDGGHSIWELAVHVTAWMEEAAERVEGRYHLEPARGNWSVPAEVTEERWRQAKQELQESVNRLVEAVERMEESRLEEMVRTAEGDGVTVFELLAGVAQHNTYHAGQMALLR